MDPTTITTTTLTVKPNGGANLTGATISVTYDSATRTATWTKTDGLNISTNYIVTISTGVKNASAIAITQAYTWSFTTSNQPYRFPHGKYVATSSQCSACHTSHTSAGARLVQQASVKATCYVCHNGTQASSNVQGEFNHSASTASGSSHPVDFKSTDNNYAADYLKCQNCHNPHGDLDVSNNLYPKLVNVSGTKQGDGVCWSCHGSASTLPAPYGNHQSTWPGQSLASATTPAGTGHDKSSLMNPSSGTQILCSSCHESHGSSLSDNLKNSITFTNPITSVTQTTTVTGDNRTACYGCHFDKYSAAADNDWFGQSTYEATITLPDGNHSNGHKGDDCQDCHQPHGSQYPNYLKNKYDMTASASRTTAYNQADYICTNCHTSFQNYSAPLTSSGTAFFNGGGATAAQKDLHYLHLQKAGADLKGNAICYECHRPHGSITSENPSQAHRVGFPASTVTATTIAPVTAVTFQHDPQASPKTGGGCTLACHGVNHRSGTPGASEIDSRYNNSGAAGSSESAGNQSCSGCHSVLVNLFGTFSGGTITPSTNNYHHGITSDAATYNDATCLSCHVDHNVFSPISNAGTAGRSYNLRQNGGNIPNTTQSNTDFQNSVQDPSGNGGLCLSCHKNSLAKRFTQPTGDSSTTTPAIVVGSYQASGHNYSVQSKFVSDGSFFQANCAKCHTDNDTTWSIKQDQNYPANPSKNVFKLHGSSIRRMLTTLNSWSSASTATANITEPVAGKGLEENLCLKCHTGTTGTDMYGGAYWTGHTAAQNISGLFAKTYKHPVASTAGIHTPTESTAQGWNYGTNRHAECEDCHNSHAAKYNDGTDKEGVSSTLTGVWGTSVTNQYTGTTGSGTPNTYTYAYTATPTKQYELCGKCHSTWAYINSTNAPTSSWPGGGKQPDVLQQFNPGNYAAHPLFKPGANQPASGANANWGTNAWRRTGTYVANGTSYTVAGLDNNFVDGWGTQSTVQCSDCHASDTKTDPRGPHGSTQKWILKKLDPSVTVTTAGGVKNPNQHTLTGTAATAANDALCLNCHRADVYGYGSNNFPTYSGTTARVMSRWSHGSNNAADLQSNLVNGSKGNTVVTFGCFNCHGGGEAGGIHGSMMTATGTKGTDPPGKRFMNGASWNGHTGLNATSGTCYTAASNSVNTCTQHTNSGTSVTYNYAY
jgi:predicted CXXCH cytochrome family protein